MANQNFGRGNPQQNMQRGGGKNQPATPDTSGFMEEVNIIGRRLRILEERYSNIDRKIQVSEQNMLNSHREINKELRTTMSDVNDLKKEINSIKEKLSLIIDELKKCAREEDMKVIEKYINLWDPVKFMTRKQVEQIVKEFIDKQE